MRQSGAISELIEALRCLPGVGPKTAQRMTLHLLQRDRDAAARLSEALRHALDKVGLCGQCRTLTEHALCEHCANPGRDRSLLCIVESPAEVFAISRSTGYKGLFFVLNGRLSPLDGIGPEELGLGVLEKRLKEDGVAELILATNTTVEGEATAHYLSDMARRHGVRTTRIAHGIPFGGELEYVDGATLSHAFDGRKDF